MTIPPIQICFWPVETETQIGDAAHLMARKTDFAIFAQTDLRLPNFTLVSVPCEGDCEEDSKILEIEASYVQLNVILQSGYTLFEYYVTRFSLFALG